MKIVSRGYRRDSFQTGSPDENRNDEPEDPAVEGEDKFDCWPEHRDDECQSNENLHSRILSKVRWTGGVDRNSGRFNQLYRKHDMDVKPDAKPEIGVICWPESR